jgi:hypothetical protein
MASHAGVRKYGSLSIISSRSTEPHRDRLGEAGGEADLPLESLDAVR